MAGAAPPEEEEALLTREQLCGVLQISQPTLVRHIEAGMPHIRLGKLTRFRLNDVISWCEERERARRDDYGPALKPIAGVTLKSRPRRKAANS